MNNYLSGGEEMKRMVKFFFWAAVLFSALGLLARGTATRSWAGWALIHTSIKGEVVKVQLDAERIAVEKEGSDARRWVVLTKRTKVYLGEGGREVPARVLKVGMRVEAVGDLTVDMRIKAKKIYILKQGAKGSPT